MFVKKEEKNMRNAMVLAFISLVGCFSAVQKSYTPEQISAIQKQFTDYTNLDDKSISPPPISDFCPGKCDSYKTCFRKMTDMSGSTAEHGMLCGDQYLNYVLHYIYVLNRDDQSHAYIMSGSYAKMPPQIPVNECGYTCNSVSDCQSKMNEVNLQTVRFTNVVCASYFEAWMKYYEVNFSK